MMNKKLDVQEEIIAKLPLESLCWNECKFFKPGKEDNCPIAQQVFEFGKKYNISTPIWECETYESKTD